MAVHLVTGHTGTPHITSADQGKLNSTMMGTGAYRLDGLGCGWKGSNSVHVEKGSLMLNGRYVRVGDTGHDVAVESGTLGVNRTDYICARYEISSSGIEQVSLVCKRGPAGGGAPSYQEGNILDAGTTVAEFPLYSLEIVGINTGAITQLVDDFRGVPDNMVPVVPVAKGGTGATSAANARAALGVGAIGTKDSLAAADIPSLDASKVTSGAFNADRIPGLAASKVTSGAFSADRIPSLDASKIGSGTISGDRIPNISAAKITAGTLPVARGGTGLTSISSVRANLASGTAANALTSNIGVTGTLGIGNGGTGATTAAGIRSNAGLAGMAPVSLYDNASGTAGTVTLSETAANFTYMDIFYASNTDNYCCCTRLYSPNGKIAQFDNWWCGSTSATLNWRLKTVKISGTSITIDYATRGSIDALITIVDNANVKIYKVVGYK